MRGMLTDKIQEKAVSFLNREIMQKELRLYPYIDYSIKMVVMDGIMIKWTKKKSKY